jgi:hypothetical protein
MKKSPQTVFKDGLDKAYSKVQGNITTMSDHAKYKQGVSEDESEGTPMIKRSIKKFLHAKKKDVREDEGYSKYYPGGKTPGLTSDVLNTILTNMGKKGIDDKREMPKNEFKKFKKKETKEQDEVTEKWSEKYKKSIDCSNPKGFSQKAHCDGRKKKETKEATGSGSSGSYVGPVFGGDNEFWEKSRRETPKLKEGGTEKVEATGSGSSGGSSSPAFAKSGSKKDWKTSKKTQMSGGEFVEEGEEQVEKVEAKEATTSGSVGGYESPSMWAKSTKKKDWGPSRKTQIPGGGFVKIKKKCTKFPYCNQGDINNVKISKNESVKEAIKNVSSKMGVSENVIKTILEHEYEKINKRTK